MVPGTTFHKPLDVSWHTKEVAQEVPNPGQFPTESTFPKIVDLAMNF